VRIIELRAQNYARLTAVEIRPDGVLVPIVGKNSAGKSSVLGAIWTALKGRAVAPPEPIHDGAERAVIRLDIGDAVVTRTFERGKLGEITTDLKVVAADGTRVRTKPQEWIDRTLAATCFNPLDFVRQPPKVQFDTLRKFVPGVDFDDIARQRQRAYDDRTAANHRLGDARVQADTIVIPPGPEPAAVDTAALVLQLADATEANSARLAAIARSESLHNTANQKLDDAEQLRARAATMEREADDMISTANALARRLPAAVDTSAITAQLASAQAVQDTRNKFSERRRALVAVETHKAASDELTAKIDALDKAKANAIAAAKLPVPGLSFGDDNAVLLNGAPLSQAGTAEKIRVGVAVGMSLNPTLRVMLVDEASELDAESLAMVEEMAREQGFQVWLARVDDTGAAPGFHIVDGRVAGQIAGGEP
jgi:hypothetical protein